MKKTFFFILGAAAMLLASCAKELNAPVESPKSLVTFVANAGSKTIIADDPDKDGNYAVTWKEGDKITIIDADGYSASYTVKPEENNTNEIVFGVEVGSAPYTAIAGPVVNVVKDGEAYKVEMKDPDGSFGGADLLATRSSSNMLTFHHALSFVEMRVADEKGVKEVSFTTSKPFFGPLSLTFDDENETPSAKVVEETKAGSAKGTLTMILPESPENAIVYVPMVKDKYKGFDVKYTNTENVTFQGPKSDKEFSTEEGGASFGTEEENIIKGAKLMIENFTASNATNNQYDCNSNLSTADNRKDFDYVWGYSGSGTVFKNGIKLGSGKATGSVSNETMLESIEAGDNFTVNVYAAVWNTDGGQVSVTYNSKSFDLPATNDAITTTSNEYNESDFANATAFVFKKVEGVNEFTVASTQNRILIDKIEIVEGGVLPAEPQEFGVSTTSLSATWDETSKTFDITAANVVSWEIVADDGLTLSQDEGNGNATITVSFDQNTGEYQLSKEIVVSTSFSPVVNEDTYTITLTQAGKPAREMDGDGSATNPYSVADALYLAGNLADNGTTTECYVTGTITALGTFKNGTYSYTIGTGDDTFEVYSGKDLGEVNFESESDIAIDQVVVIYGKIKKYVNYQSETTLEMDGGNYLYSINGATSILTGITLGEKKTVYYTGDTFEKPTVTASYRGKANAVVTETTTFIGYNNLSTPGNYTVTASYTEGEIKKDETYDIIVYNGTYYNISSSVNDEARGSMIVSSTQAREGEAITVTINPNPDYIFSSLSLNGEDKTALVSGNEFTFDMPASDVTIFVSFANKPEETNAIKDNFTAISGNLDNNIAFEAAQGDAANAPIIPNNETFIRIYQNGGTFTVTPNNGATITEVVIGSNQATSVTYSIDGGNSSSSNSIAKKGTLTVSKSISEKIVFTCKGTDKNSRLEVNYLKVTYYGGQKRTQLVSPSSFTCSDKTSSSLTFTWNAVTNATGYKVSTDGGQNYSEATVSTSYTWTGLEAETSYTLYVKAVDVNNIYLDSDPVSAQGTTEEASQGGEEITATLTLSSSIKFGTTSGSTLNDDKGNTWTCTGNNIQNSYQSTYSGQQFGTGSTANTFTFTCDVPAGKTVKSVKITAACGNSNGKYKIEVGSSVWQDFANLSNTAKEYSSTGSTIGQIKITLQQPQSGTKKAVYLGKIEVKYQ